MYKKLSKFWITASLALAIAACGGGSGGTSPRNPVTSSPPPGLPVDTLRFENTGFTEVEIRNSFAFIVQHGDEFSIEVEIDREYSQLVSVTQEGVRLTIEFDPTFSGDIRAQVARGIVTLPVLDLLRVDGSVFVDLAGFNQSFLQIIQSGSSHIVGANSRIDFFDAVLNGSCHLDLRHVTPLPAANVVLNGSSQATLSLMTGGTLTGSAAGSSNLSFFGASISLAVQTFNLATVTWLGLFGT